MEPITLALTLAQFAPSIMRFFGAGEKPVSVAEKVVGIAKAVTGAQSPEDAIKAMRENAQLAQQFQLAVLAADTDLEKAALADRANARTRDVEVRKLAGGYNWRADIMIVACVVALCVMVNKIIGDNIKPEVLAIFNMAIGALLKMLGDAFSFEFGSSRGSKEKDQLLGKGTP
jgi:hypothetical protein